MAGDDTPLTYHANNAARPLELNGNAIHFRMELLAVDHALLNFRLLRSRATSARPDSIFWDTVPWLMASQRAKSCFDILAILFPVARSITGPSVDYGVGTCCHGAWRFHCCIAGNEICLSCRQQGLGKLRAFVSSPVRPPDGAQPARQFYRRLDKRPSRSDTSAFQYFL